MKDNPIEHTPGPWKILYGGHRYDEGFTIASDNASSVRVKTVCECWPCDICDQRHREELSANAALIAAAPELYDAARELIAWHERNPAAVDLQRIVEAFERIVERIKSPCST